MRLLNLLLVVPVMFSTDCGGRSETMDNIGGELSSGGAAATGGTPATGGCLSTNESSGSGCTGSYETAQSCTGLCVANMVMITAPSGYPNYSIDATEVTQGQYDAWLATNPALPSTADANCGYVTTYTAAGRDYAPSYTGPDYEHQPVGIVNWCDAYEYCLGVGKRLCGAIGGGPNDYASYADATQSQWYRACSSGGTNGYPYGNTYQPSYCNGLDYWNDNASTMQTVAVGSLANCVTLVTGFAGVYDLSGNVWEWEDSCSGTGEGATCNVRGGAYAVIGDLTCSDCDSYPRNVSDPGIGFRCCSG